MVLFVLYMKADLENVASISIRPGCTLCMTVKNPLSDWEVREQVVVDTSGYLEQEESDREPPRHFQLQWESNKKLSTLVVLNPTEAKSAVKKFKKKVKQLDTVLPRSYTATDAGVFAPILMVECRGLEPTVYFARVDEFVVTSEAGTTFDEEVDLSPGDWSDYDVDHDVPVSVTEVGLSLIHI